jgi:hypothetical protein
MKPIFATVDAGTHLMIVPDIRAEMDGHPVLTYDYHIYTDSFGGSGEYHYKPDDEALAVRMEDPEYLGYISFERPDKIFTYTPGAAALQSNDVQEIIEVISHYRDSKKFWQV